MYCAAVDVQVPGVSKWELAKYRARHARPWRRRHLLPRLDPSYRRRSRARLELEVPPPQPERRPRAATRFFNKRCDNKARKSLCLHAFHGLPRAGNAIIHASSERAHRLAVRTPPFHGGNRGSIPLGRTKGIQRLRLSRLTVHGRQLQLRLRLGEGTATLTAAIRTGATPPRLRPQILKLGVAAEVAQQGRPRRPPSALVTSRRTITSAERPVSAISSFRPFKATLAQ